MINTITYIANILKDKAKEKHENFLRDNNTSNIIYIYTNKSEIENHINTTIYLSTISIVTHDYLKKINNINIYIIKLIIIHLEIKMIDKSLE